MKKFLTVAIVLSMLMALCACGTKSQPAATETPEPTLAATETPEPTAEQTLAQKTLDSMSLDEKIGQLFIIRPDALDPDLTSAEIDNASKYGVTELSGAMTETLRQYPVGGIAMFGKNITSPQQLTQYVDALQSASSTPLIMGIDEEGGSVSRIANSKGFNVKKYKSMAAIGATGDTQNAEDVGYTIGSYLTEYGFNLDFAPDADVNTNPNNIVIGDRSFGSDPELVAKMVSAEIAGLHKAGVMSCAKHFPGHGDTKGDTHTGYVAVEKTWDELEACELIPFVAAINAGTDMIMAAHITAKNVTDDGLPASLSKEMITDKLRGELGYNGVVITDAMSMGAVTSEYTSAEAAVKAFTAGADIMLMPDDYKAAFKGIRDAVNDGTISMERLNESVLRILTLKEQYGILK